MNRTIQRLSGAVAFFGVVGALCFTGCAPVDPMDAQEQVDEAQQPQLDPSQSVWSSVTLTFADPSTTQLATVYVFTQALGSYVTGKEYWFVNLNSVGLIGQYSLNMAFTGHDTTTAPAGPGYASEQAFELEEFPASRWGTSWSTDPFSRGSLYNGPGQISLRLTSTASPASLDSITWYQVIPSAASPYNIIPNGAFTLDTSGAVVVPSGYLGYNVSQVP
jgi:hypothetical protein